MTTAELLRTAWDPSPLVAVLCASTLGAYGLRFGRWAGKRALAFVLAVILFFVALASPIGVLARGYLFSAHMLQHLLLVLVVPALGLLGWPRHRDRARGARAGRGHQSERSRAEPKAPAFVSAWLAGVSVMWIWHAPILCNAAAHSPAVQALQTASLLVFGLAFWSPILSPRTEKRLSALTAVLYLFAACVGCTLLGIVLTLSPVEVCSAYMNPVDSLGAMPLLREGWGLTHRADQELGGLLMWVPACFVYAGAILATLGRYYAEEHVPPRAAEGSR